MTKFSALLTLFLISSSAYIFGDGTFIYDPKHIPAPNLPQIQPNQPIGPNIIRPIVVLVLVMFPRSQD